MKYNYETSAPLFIHELDEDIDCSEIQKVENKSLYALDSLMIQSLERKLHNSLQTPGSMITKN